MRCRLRIGVLSALSSKAVCILLCCNGKSIYLFQKCFTKIINLFNKKMSTLNKYKTIFTQNSADMHPEDKRYDKFYTSSYQLYKSP